MSELKDTCKNCAGRGHFTTTNGQQHTCHYCDGKGEIVVVKAKQPKKEAAND